MAKTAKKAETAENENLPAPKGLGTMGLGDFSSASDFLGDIQTEDIEKGSASFADVREAMGNVRPMLENVKIKGHGANLFQFDDGAQTPGPEGLVGVIAAFTRHNSYFDKSFDDAVEGELPPCFSNDGALIANNAESPQSDGGCASCPRNRDAKTREAREAAFESAENQTKEKPETCTNYLSMAFMMPGRDLPVRIRFTNRTFKAWARYCQEIGTVKGRFFPHEVATKVTLKNIEGQNEYSVGEFEFVGALKPAMRENFALQVAGYTALLQRAAEVEERDDASDEAKAAMNSAKAEAKAAETSGQGAGL